MLPWLKKPLKKTVRSRSPSAGLPWSDLMTESSADSVAAKILQGSHISPSPQKLATKNKRMEGGHWEVVVKDYLIQHGLQFLQSNVFTKLGELDLIMLDGKTLVIVEVRSRARSRHGSAAASVNVHKRRRVILAARCWLHQQRSRFPDPQVRFDVVAIDRGVAGHFDLAWYRAAFDADGWV